MSKKDCVRGRRAARGAEDDRWEVINIYLAQINHRSFCLCDHHKARGGFVETVDGGGASENLTEAIAVARRPETVRERSANGHPPVAALPMGVGDDTSRLVGRSEATDEGSLVDTLGAIRFSFAFCPPSPYRQSQSHRPRKLQASRMPAWRKSGKGKKNWRAVFGCELCLQGERGRQHGLGF